MRPDEIVGAFPEVELRFVDVVELFDVSLDALVPDAEFGDPTVRSLLFETEAGDLDVADYYDGVQSTFHGPANVECSPDGLAESVEDALLDARDAGGRDSMSTSTDDGRHRRIGQKPDCYSTAALSWDFVLS